MKAPIVQHPCEGLVLRFLWGQGNAERQLTTERGRAKLRSFDSPIAREPICSLHAQQPGKRCNVRIPREESSVHRARAAAAPEGDVALSRGLPVGEVPSCGKLNEAVLGVTKLLGGLRRWASESRESLLLQVTDTGTWIALLL